MRSFGSFSNHAGKHDHQVSYKFVYSCSSSAWTKTKAWEWTRFCTILH